MSENMELRNIIHTLWHECTIVKMLDYKILTLHMNDLGTDIKRTNFYYYSSKL